MSYGILEVTGPDGAGKTTQCKLLARALEPARYFHFPDSSHWSGKMIYAQLAGARTGVVTHSGVTYVENDRDPLTFQMLQQINRQAHRQMLLDGLKTHHWVLDRYITDTLAYGLPDGCPEYWLTAMMQQQLRPSLTILMLPERRVTHAGRSEDVYEADTSFQEQVTATYERLVQQEPSRYYPFRFRLEEGIPAIHHRLCALVQERLGWECQSAIGREPLAA